MRTGCVSIGADAEAQEAFDLALTLELIAPIRTVIGRHGSPADDQVSTPSTQVLPCTIPTANAATSSTELMGALVMKLALR